MVKLQQPHHQYFKRYVYFEFPGVLGGRLVHDSGWNGKTVISQRYFFHQPGFSEAIVNTDPGASVLGEFAIGTNKEVTHFCKDILIDEKIGGTVHMALGRAYPKCGGKNQSAIHWDIVKDTRKEGQIFLDGELIFENGKVLL